MNNINFFIFGSFMFGSGITLILIGNWLINTKDYKIKKVKFFKYSKVFVI